MAFELVGNAEAVELLRGSLERERLAHAYVFLGPEQVGKRTLALQLAMALNCARPEEAPCGGCLSCRKVHSGNHPDVRLLGGQGRLGIAEVRELQREAHLSPVEGRYRVFVLDGFQEATVEAANALLKTLEEPPPRAVLVLVAQEGAPLLPTVLSRCQALHFRLVPSAWIRRSLVERGVEPQRAEQLAALALGRPGWAHAALADPSQLQAREERLREVLEAMTSPLAERLARAQSLGRDAQTALEYVGLAEEWWRQALRRSTGAGAARSAPSPAGLPQGTREVTMLLKSLRRTRELLTAYVNPRLAMESLLLSLPSPQES